MLTKLSEFVTYMSNIRHNNACPAAIRLRGHFINFQSRRRRVKKPRENRKKMRVPAPCITAAPQKAAA